VEKEKVAVNMVQHDLRKVIKVQMKVNPHPKQLLCRNVKRFRGGFVFEAHRLLHHSTLGLRVIKKKKKRRRRRWR